jgi:hypothetical protein
MRYHVIVRKGSKVRETRKFNDYDHAMDDLDFIEDRIEKLYGIGYAVEFKDTKPFLRDY